MMGAASSVAARKLHDKRHEERRKQDIKDAKAAIARL